MLFRSLPFCLAGAEDALTADLLARSRVRSPVVAEVEAGREAAAAEVRQAGAWANPEVEVGVGRTEVDEERDATWSVGVRQRLPWPGRRSAAVAAARAGLAVQEAEAATAWLETEAGHRRAIIEASAAEAALALAEVEREVVESLARQVEGRVRAGDAGKAERARCAVEKVQAQTACAEAALRVRRARQALAALCGEAVPTLPPLADPAAPPDLAALRTVAAQHPALRRAEATLRQREAGQVAARRAWRPDLDLGVEVGGEGEERSATLVLAVAVPVFDRGAVAIAVAGAEQRRAEAALVRERRRLTLDLDTAHAAAVAAQAGFTSLRDEARPQAVEALRLIQAAHAAGEASLTEVLEARRALHAVDAALLAARVAGAEAAIALGEAAGTFATVTAEGR